MPDFTQETHLVLFNNSSQLAENEFYADLLVPIKSENTRFRTIQVLIISDRSVPWEQATRKFFSKNDLAELKKHSIEDPYNYEGLKAFATKGNLGPMGHSYLVGKTMAIEVPVPDILDNLEKMQSSVFKSFAFPVHPQISEGNLDLFIKDKTKNSPLLKIDNNLSDYLSDDFIGRLKFARLNLNKPKPTEQKVVRGLIHFDRDIPLWT